MGSIFANFGSNNAYTVTLEWTSGTQSITDNTTSVKFVCTLKSNRSGASFTGVGKTDKLTVNGKSYNINHSAYTVPGAGSVKLWEHTASVAHDEDGSFNEKNISAVISIGTSFSSSGYIDSVTASGKMSLTTIPRASSMVIGGTTLGKEVSFSITAAATAFTHELRYAFGKQSGVIASGFKGGKQTWTPPIEWASEFTNASAGKVTYTLTTKNGSTTIGTKTYDSELTIPAEAAMPSVSLYWVRISPDNSGSATDKDGIRNLFVQGYSKAKVEFDDSHITLKYGASIKGYKISCNGVTNSAAPYVTGVLNGTSAQIVCTVTDSRGYSASETLDIAILPYSKPTFGSARIYRANASGEEDSGGIHIFAKAAVNFSPLDGNNACPTYGYYRAAAGDYGNAVLLKDIGIGESMTNQASETMTYVAKIVATDKLGNSVSYEATIPTDSVSFHIKEGGKAAAFGKYAEEDNKLEVDWDLKVNGALELATALAIEQGGTGVETLGELIQTVFTNGNAAVAKEYPTSGGYYCTTGTEIFANLAHTHSNYGVLVIFRAFIYQMHIYVDLDQRMFYGWSSNSGGTVTEPTNWQRVDGIVEEGTSGIWTYRKYQSGLAECWGTQDYSGTSDTAWGSLYRMTCTAPNFPFTFKSVPVANLDIVSTTGSSYWISSWAGGSTSSLGTFALVRPVAGGTVGVTVAFHARGRWK